MAWCSTPDIAEQVAAFFVDYAETSYISHSELQIGRAVTLHAWADDVRARVHRLVLRAIATSPDALEGMRLATLMCGGRLEGFAVVAFAGGAGKPYASLEDLLVIPDSRGHGLGKRFVEWISQECRARGMHRLYLESGVRNHRAHEFFGRQGFQQTSVVMMRDL
jgi:GNAT superfamily N-acetyltransferase